MENPSQITEAPPHDPGALEQIRRRITLAERQAGRTAGSARLIAVSKQQPWTAISPVLEAGQTDFGENRVQEAVSRWTPVRDRVRLHLIGPLQTNKVAEAVTFFDVIHTLDRVKLALALASQAQKAGFCPQLYVQVNTGEEPQKSGVLPREADAFIAQVRDELDLPVVGLMCIPPVGDPAALHFCLLADLARRNGVGRLSMGMSDDFELAVRLGATDVRVGSAIFGQREALAAPAMPA